MSRDEKLARLEVLCAELLDIIDPEPEREGLDGTPHRWAKWWLEFAERGHSEDGNLDTTFVSARVDEMIVASGIEVWSLCEHHLLPFRVSLSVGYITNERVLGLSKIPRICHRFASRLQIQERLVADIRSAIVERVGTEDVAVVGTGEHLCATMRGIRTPTRFTTSALGGVFRKTEVRDEFLRLTKGV